MTRRPTPQLISEDTLAPASDDVRIAIGDGAVMLPVAACRMDGGTQSRVRIEQSVVKQYQDDLEKGDRFEPIEVYFDGTSYWVSDGFHRLLAHAGLGRTEINAIVKQGTRRDAVLASTGANPRHGLQRTQEDMRRAVMVLLEDEEWSQWSDRKIAETTHTSHPFVAQLRRLLTGNRSALSKAAAAPAINTAPVPAVKSNGRSASSRIEPQPAAPVSKPVPTPVVQVQPAAGAWSDLAWAVYDWALEKFLPARRQHELKDMIMTRQSGRYWKSLEAHLANTGISGISTNAILGTISTVRLALENGNVPERVVNHLVPEVVKITPPVWCVEHQPDGRRKMIHSKEGKETAWMLTAAEAMLLAAQLAQQL